MGSLMSKCRAQDEAGRGGVCFRGKRRPTSILSAGPLALPSLALPRALAHPCKTQGTEARPELLKPHLPEIRRWGGVGRRKAGLGKVRL